MADKITFKLELPMDEIPTGSKTEFKRVIGDFILEQVLKDVSKGISPVYGKKWDGLSSDYKNIKKKVSGSTLANMELYGDMLDALEYKIKPDGIEFGIWDSKQAAKADGHNNHSGKSKLPLRRFIPTEDETFRPGINREIQEIMDEYIE